MQNSPTRKKQMQVCDGQPAAPRSIGTTGAEALPVPVADVAESAERHAKQVEAFAAQVAAMVTVPADGHDLDSFPHHLATGTKQHLLTAAYVHLKQTAFAKHTLPLSTMSNKVLLSGPFGADMYQEALVRYV